MEPIRHLVEAALYAEDLERAESFYRGVLGLPLVDKEPGRHLFFRVGESMLLIFRPEATLQGGGSVPPHGAHGPGHVALGVPADALEGWRERLQAHGIEVEQEQRWPRGGRSLYFRDPDGNSVELITPGCWGLPSGW